MLRTFFQYWRNSRNIRWGITVGAALTVAMSLVLMFLLAQATNDPEAYERNFQTLLVANLVVGCMLAAVVGWMGWRVWKRFRRRKFGSRLLLKLVAVFTLVASVPGALTYLVSYQFVTRSIESWFDVRVEHALDAGLSLGRNVLDALTADTASRTQAAATQLGVAQPFGLALTLEQLRVQQNADQLILWDQNGQRIASAGIQSSTHALPAPTADVRAALRTKPVYTSLEGLDDAGDASTSFAPDSPAASTTPAATPRTIDKAPAARIVAYSLVRPGQFGLLDQAWVLEVVKTVPPELLRNALVVQDTNREYQERALARTSMQRMFIGTLTLTLILAVFGAVLLAALLASQLTRPLFMLAEGVQQVAEGNLGPKPIYQGHDELGTLTHAFARMTQQLADTQQALRSSVVELDASRSELQTILDNLSTGVLMLRANGCIVSANPAATRILGQEAAALEGHTLGSLPGMSRLGEVVQQQFDNLQEPSGDSAVVAAVSTPSAAQALQGAQEAAAPATPGAGEAAPAARSSSPYWQQTLELNPAEHEGLQHDAITLVLRGATLHDAAIPDARLLVFEDISAIVSAQRTQAWGEVARRLAHEIKNPLTPIQLSAERLELKLMHTLPEKEQAVLRKSVRTIVEQVDAMKRLVNEFRDYARLPAAQLRPLDLNGLITDILHLYGDENATVPIRAELDPGCMPVLADAAQLRQVIHNLVQNAQDAQEQAGRASEPVLLQTQWRPASRRVRMSILDVGGGFPDNILQRAFEPYVTTKAKGTGLGLPVVKKIADEHGASLTVTNRVQDGQVIGAQISLIFQAADGVESTAASTPRSASSPETPSA